MALSALFTFLLAIGSTVLSIALLRPISARLGLVDHPDKRKDHVGAIPLIGGIAIWFAFTISLLFVGITPKLAILIVSGGLLMLVGAVDDAKDLPPRLRLLLHIVAASIMCVCSVESLFSLWAKYSYPELN